MFGSSVHKNNVVSRSRLKHATLPVAPKAPKRRVGGSP